MLQKGLQRQNEELLSAKQTIPYARFSPLFRCILPHFERYERVFFATSYALSLIALFSEALSTLLHLQTTDSLIFGNEDDADTWGCVVGLVATFAAGANVLLPFAKAAGECREVSAIMARHLMTAEDVPMTQIYRIYSQTMLCFRHPTMYDGCTIEELAHANPKSFYLSTHSHPVINTRHSTGRKSGSDFLKHPGMLFTAYSEVLLCAAQGFDRLSRRFFLIFYMTALLQIFFTAATALFHADNLGLQDKQVSNLLGLLSGFIGTIAGGILAVVPIETAAFRTRNAYCICNEYLVSEQDLPATVIQSLYETPCLCFRNPMFHEECATKFIHAV